MRVLVATVVARTLARQIDAEKAGAWIALSGSLLTSAVPGGIWMTFAVNNDFSGAIGMVLDNRFWNQLALFSSR